MTNTAQFAVPICNPNGTATETSSLCCDYNSPAEFYVFVGVMGFLYSLAAIILHVVFDDTHRKNDNIPTAVSK